MRTLVNSIIIAFLLVIGSVRAAVLPDPTRPAQYRPEALIVQELPKELINWKVTAIRIAGGDRTAIVNGSIVREGDIVGPAEILEIQPVSVVLNYDNKKISVRLFGDLVQKKVKENQ